MSYFRVHFLPCHVLRFLSLSYCYTVVIISCLFGMFFSILSLTVLSYFTVSFYRRLLYRNFLPHFILCFLSVFQGTFSCFAPFCVLPIRICTSSCYLLSFKAMCPLILSSTSFIAFDPVFSNSYIHSFCNRSTQLHFFHILHLTFRFLLLTFTSIFQHFLLHALF
jgi:hypothetical protein